MDCIQVQSFCTFCQICFTCGSTVFCFYTHFQVFLCAVCYNFTKQFCKFSSVLSFFISCFFPVKTDFRITFSVSNSCHSQVHTYFRTFTLEVCSQVSFDVFRNIRSDTYFVLCSPCHCCIHLFEFRSRCFTYWTDFRSCFAFINITTYCTYKFCHFFDLLFTLIFNKLILGCPKLSRSEHSQVESLLLIIVIVTDIKIAHLLLSVKTFLIVFFIKFCGVFAVVCLTTEFSCFSRYLYYAKHFLQIP